MVHKIIQGFALAVLYIILANNVALGKFDYNKVRIIIYYLGG